MRIRKEVRKISESSVSSWLYASLVVSSFMMMIGFAYALPVYLSPLDGGALQPNTEFDYVFNFTTSSDCSGVLLSNSSTITTDAYGFGFVDLDISSLSSQPSYMCEYRDGSLRKVHNFSDMVLGTVWASGMNVGGTVNATAFVGDGSGLSGISGGLWTNSSGNATYVDGKVGIGTTSPTDTLDIDGQLVVRGDNVFEGMQLLLDGDASVGPYINAYTDKDGKSTANYGSGRWSINSAGHTFSVSSTTAIGDTRTWNDRMIIGTNSFPSVQVKGQSHTSLQITADGAYSSQLTFANSSGVQYSLGLDDTDGKFKIYSGTGIRSSSEFVIDGSGNVGIGTTSPLSKLDVSGGDIRLDTNEAILFGDSAEAYIKGLSGSYLALGVSNEKMRIDSSGNVGIGTTSPTGKLNVYDSSTAEIILGDSNSLMRFVSSGGNNYIQSAINESSGSSADLRFTNALVSNTWMTIKSTGNVGIGTTSPSAKLEVNGTNGASKFTGHEIIMNRASNNYIIADNALGQLVFRTGGYNDRMTIDSSGNVGIGTSSPSAKLHLYKNDSSVTLGSFIVEQDGDGDSSIQYSLTSLNNWITGIDNNDSDKFKISNSNSLGTTDRLVIDSSGNVGIGTASPSAPLSVFSTSGDIIHVQRGTQSLFNLGAGSLESTDYIRWGRDGVSDFVLNENGGVLIGTNVGIGNLGKGDLSVTGNVGIGTTSPGAKLEVNGSVNVTTGNITIGSQNKMCFTQDCSSYIWHNGTNLQIVG